MILNITDACRGSKARGTSCIDYYFVVISMVLEMIEEMTFDENREIVLGDPDPL